MVETKVARRVDPGVQEQTYDRDAAKFHDASELLSTWIYLGGPEIDRFAQDLPEGAKVWDQGSASGRVVRRLVRNGVRPEDITGVEISPDQVEIARREIPQASFLAGDLATVELGENSMDAATQHMVAEHLSDETLAMVNGNTFRTLKPGGRYFVVATHPEKTAISSGLNESGSFMTSFPWGGEGLNYHRTKEDMVRAYEEAGFVVDEVRDLNMPSEAQTTHPDDYAKYTRKYPYIRITLEMHKPL